MDVRGPMMWVLLTCYIFSHIITSHNNGFVEAKSLPKFEDLEIVKKLKTINKPAVKIIKTIDGERYGCVDFFKQPAFDHPSMKNHTYHYKMRPTWKGMKERNTNDTGFGYLWENGVGCPIGTVPIRRVTKDDILALNSFEDNYKPHGSWNTTTDDQNNAVNTNQYHFAVGRTKNIGMSYNGATMDLCVTAPKVKPNQFSASRIYMQFGADFIQAGLTVHPALYKDSQPRTFVYTQAGGKSCFNSNCDVGMVHVRQDFPMGTAMPLVSTRGAKRSHFVIIGLIKDQKNGNWWLQFGDQAEEVGFWPSNRFRQSSGNYVEWGGEVYSASQPGPQMGYGFLPSGEMRYDAYIKRISILDGNYHVDRQVNHLEDYWGNPRAYDVINRHKPNDPNIGRMILYGGPGNI